MFFFFSLNTLKCIDFQSDVAFELHIILLFFLSTNYPGSVCTCLNNYITQQLCCNISFLHMKSLETVGAPGVGAFSFMICVNWVCLIIENQLNAHNISILN